MVWVPLPVPLVLVILFSLVLFLRVRRAIDSQQFYPSYLLEVTLGLLIVLIGFFLFFYLLLAS
jgi:hypothetical protein